MKKQFSFLSALVGATLLATGAWSIPALAHEADCPYCDMSITENTPTQDNKAALIQGKKRVSYKCVYCAVADAKSEYKGNLSISAPSEKKGRPVLIKRIGAKWSTLPATAAFVNPSKNLKHRVCQQQSRAFTTKAAAAAYAKANNGEVVTLARLIELAE